MMEIIEHRHVELIYLQTINMKIVCLMYAVPQLHVVLVSSSSPHHRVLKIRSQHYTIITNSAAYLAGRSRKSLAYFCLFLLGLFWSKSCISAILPF